MKGMQKRQFQMPTSAGFLQFSIAEELSGYKLDVNKAIIILLAIVLSIKILALLV